MFNKISTFALNISSSITDMITCKLYFDRTKSTLCDDIVFCFK